MSAGACVDGLFEGQAGRRPEGVALRFGGEAVSYDELRSRARRIAHALRAQGVGRGQRVGLCLERGTDMVAAVLGVLESGAAYVPLDPAFPDERLRFMAEDAELSALVSTTDLAASFDLDPARRLLLDDEGALAGVADGPIGPDPELDARPHDPAYVIYTSGSTGRPKGVVVPHRAVVNFLTSMARTPGMTSDDVLLAVTTLSFDIAVLELLLPLSVGASVVIAGSDEVMDGRALRRLLEEHDATIMQATPVSWRLLLEAGWRGGTDFKALVGGEALPKDLADQLIACDVELWNMYGPTETTVWSTCARIHDTSDGISIGTPIANTTVYVLDHNRQLCPTGVPGELYIGGDGVTLGYWNRPELTAQHFIADPYRSDPQARLYRTGDLARWRHDGSLEHLGRLDHQVKIRGFRIELGEIEAALAQHPSVLQAVATVRSDTSNNQRIVAYLVCTERSPDPADLRRELSRTLPAYMVPTAFVELDEIPLTPNAKVDRRALPVPDDANLLRSSHTPPRTDVERALAEIWEGELGVEGISVHDDFFALGGSSILAVGVLELMRQVGFDLDVRALFESPTIASLATRDPSTRGVVAAPPNGIPDGCRKITPAMLPLVELSEEDISRIATGVPGGEANIRDIYPLAPLQEGILFHDRLASGRGTYLTTTTYAFDDRALVDRYVAALQTVLDRHDVLRTAVLWEGISEPVQVVLREAELPVEEVAVEPASGARASLLGHFDSWKASFDVREAPLIRLLVAHDVEADRWLMLQVVHHLIDDQVTMELVHEEVATLLEGRGNELPEPLPFRDFVAHARLAGADEEHEAFFHGLLADVSEPTLPYGLANVRGDGSDITEVRRRLPAELGRRLRQVALKRQVSLASLVHLAWARVLGRLSGQDDVVFGTVLLGRMYGGQGAAGILGMCINTLPVRVCLGSGSALDRASETHAQLLQLMRHEHASLALAQRCSGIEANAPLFSALLNYRHGAPGTRLDEESSIFEGVRLLDFVERTNYPLTLNVDDFEEGLVLNAQVVPPADPGRICDYMLVALDSLAAVLESEDESPVSSVDVLPAPERHRLLVEWNDTARDYADKPRLHRLIEAQVVASPEAVAVEFEGATITYEELNERANRLARELRDRSVGPDVLVGVLAERSIEMVLALLAVLKAGGAYVPLDPSYPEERLAHMLEDADTQLVLAQSHLLHKLPEERPDVLLLDPSRRESRDHDGANLQDLGGPRDLAYAIFTSGSTGRPKGAMIEHRSICNRLWWMQETYGLTPSDRVLQKTQFSFDVSVWEFFWPLLVGARLVVARPEGHRDSAYLVDLIRRSGITTMHFVPSMLRVFLEEPEVESCASLKRVISSGEALPHDLQERFFERLPGTELHNLYGPTEAAVDVTHWACEPGDSRTTVPIGKPVANTSIYLLDENMEPVPEGVPGELHIGGVQVGRGYAGRADLTAERFVPDPFSHDPTAKLYKTGDLARHLPDGAVEYLGRIDHQVKIRGQRIELGEIEAVLDGHGDVAQSVVLAREDTPGDQRLVAYVVSHETRPSGESLRDHLARELPAYMVPSAFVLLDQLPLTSSGKVDRKRLPKPDYSGSEDGYVAPRSSTETRMAEIWAEVLDVERVGIHDNFFELGGHSLLAVTLVERMRRAELGGDIQTLFEYPTVAELAEAAVQEEDTVSVPPNLIPPEAKTISPDMLSLVELTAHEIERIVAAVPGGAPNIQDIYPLAPLQEGFLFHHRLAEEGDGYLLMYQFGFQDREALDAYVSALQTVIDENDILRTAVLWEGLDTPIQVVYRTARLVVQELDLYSSDGDVARQMWDRINLRSYRLDVRRAPLLRVLVAHDEASGRWVLQQVVHHLIEDQTTMRLVQDEVDFQLRTRDRDRPAPPLPFRNFVAQARLGMPLSEHEAFFRDLLGDLDQPTLPFGLTDIRTPGSEITEVRALVTSELSRRVRAVVRRFGVSPASVFHLVWAQVLSRTTGNDDVVFGTVLLGRTRSGEGADRILGPCINTLPIRLQTGHHGVRDALLHTHRVLARIMQHEHAPLAVAQQCSSVPPSSPLFSSLLNYRHSPGASKALAVASEIAVKGDAPLWLFQDIEGREFLNFEERTNYPVELSVDDFGDDFGLNAQVQQPLDPGRICDYVIEGLEQLVASLEETPDASMAGLSVLPKSERHRLLEEWNDTDEEYRADACVDGLFEGQAGRRPEGVALRFGGEAVSYDELRSRARRIAHALRAQGVGRGQRVGLCLERGTDMVAAVLGVLESGAAYVPLDPAFPDERLRFMAEDAELSALVSTTDLAASFDLDPARRLLLDDEGALAGVADGPIGPDPELDARPHDPAYVIYTSGSTGRPKGVVVPHRAVVNFLTSMARTPGMTSDDVLLAVTTLSFDIAVLELLLPLSVGASVVIAGSDEVMDGRALRRLLEEHDATIMQATPVSWRLLLEAGWRGGTDFKALVGGEALPKDLADQLIACDVELWNMYGPTETTVWSTCARIHDTSDGISIGTPIANTTVYVLDHNRQLCPTGVPGELYIGGDGVTLGYWNRPELTAQHFIADPYRSDPQARLYRTGDLARWRHDGSLEHLGRLDHQVKIRGFRIELGEIEAALAQHPSVLQAVATVRSDTSNNQRIVAYCIPTAAGSLKAMELRRHLRARLPEYMIPNHFVPIDEFPLTPNGKVDRNSLPEDLTAESTLGRHEAPANEIERKIASIWSDLIQPLRPVSRHDRFFELGGHSLLAMRAVQAIEDGLGVTLQLRWLINESLAELALRCRSASLLSAAGAPHSDSPSA